MFNVISVLYFMIKSSVREYIMNLRFFLFYVLADDEVLDYVYKVDFVQPLTYEEIMLGFKGMNILFKRRMLRYQVIVF